MSTAPRLKILDYCETELGVLCLRRRELLSRPGTIVTEVTLDHEFLMSSYNTESENALAAVAIEWHGAANLMFSSAASVSATRPTRHSPARKSWMSRCLNFCRKSSIGCPVTSFLSPRCCTRSRGCE